MSIDYYTGITKIASEYDFRTLAAHGVKNAFGSRGFDVDNKADCSGSWNKFSSRVSHCYVIFECWNDGMESSCY